MMPLFVKDDLIEPSDDWPNLKKERPNPPKHEDGGRGRQNKIFLRNFLNKSQDGSAWFCRNFPAWLSKKIAEFSPKFEELSRIFSKGIRILKLKYLKGLNGSYFAFTSTYLCPSSFLILFAFNWFELKIIFCLKEWKIKTSTETVNRLLSCPHTNNIKFAPLTCCKIMNHCRPKLLIRGCDQAAPGWGNSRVKYEYFRELMPHFQAFRFAGKIRVWYSNKTLDVP